MQVYAGLFSVTTDDASCFNAFQLSKGSWFPVLHVQSTFNEAAVLSSAVIMIVDCINIKV